MYKLTYRYINLLRSRFLEVAEPDGRVFPYVGVLGMPSHMTPSLFNKAIKKVWAEFLEGQAARQPACHYVQLSRHVFVSAVHSSASRKQMAETTAHMSHTLHTAVTHCEAQGAMQLTSRGCMQVVLTTSVFGEPRAVINRVYWRWPPTRAITAHTCAGPALANQQRIVSVSVDPCWFGL